MKERRFRVIRGTDEGRRNQLRQGFGEPAVADQAELGQHLVEPAAGLGRNAARAVEGAPIDRAAVDKARAELWRSGRRHPDAVRKDRLKGHEWRYITGAR